MKRCLILIGNEGSPAEGNFLPGVRQDIERYRAFFRSDFGGAWEDSEIEPINYGWSREMLRSALLRRRRREGLDYVLIVFAGHGYAEREGNVFFELNQDHEVSLSNIASWLPDQKMLMIADSCQSYLSESLLRSLNESIRTFSAGGRISDSRNVKRNRYNYCISIMQPGAKAFVSAVSPGECAADTSKGGLFSRTLLDLTEKIIGMVPGREDITIDMLHDRTSEIVTEKTHGQQHPSKCLVGGSKYPPFLIL